MREIFLVWKKQNNSLIQKRKFSLLHITVLKAQRDLVGGKAG